ncbi:hypothetical protein RFM23_05325 [Mesorhizobium abyssinicae]|uniref:DUF982 domain-containing protein n=1 Tax=Mesorhizobium abyssinicae TaxID=1209958 RepID=A0ABU5AID1_9HYPH|nr:hypothetical protein [Mesorhizobium abyssinicae]MDX8537043.1 hypothetical protein [Mesorhizobium abyssinicae]
MHTPGPWIAIESHDKREDGYIREATATEDGRHVAVAQVARAARPFSEYRANARLIAAAPDLLEVVKICLKAEQERREKLLPNAPATTYCEARIAAIEAAIAKAGGR